MQGGNVARRSSSASNLKPPTFDDNQFSITTNDNSQFTRHPAHLRPTTPYPVSSFILRITSAEDVPSSARTPPDCEPASPHDIEDISLPLPRVDSSRTSLLKTNSIGRGGASSKATYQHGKTTAAEELPKARRLRKLRILAIYSRYITVHYRGYDEERAKIPRLGATARS